MKKILLILLLGTMVTADLGSAVIEANSRDFTSEPTQRRRLTLTLIEAGPVVVGPWLIAGDSESQFTATNGVAYFSNVLAGAYRLDIAGSPGRSFPITVPDTNGVLSAAALVNTTNLNTDFYTATQVDALIAAGAGSAFAAADTVVSNGLSARLLATNTALAAAIVAATNGLTSGTSGALTNNDTRAINFATATLGSTNGGAVGLTNATHYIVNPINGTGLTGSRLGSGYLWASTAGDGIMALAPSSVSFYTNVVFADGMTGNGASLTNIPLTGVTGLTNALDYLTNNIGGSSTQTNIHYAAVTNLTDRLASFALTNAVQGSNVFGTLNIANLNATNLNIFITNAAALATDANGKLTNGVAGLVAASLSSGTNSFAGNGAGLTNIAGSNIWLNSTTRAPWWTSQSFGSGYLYKQRDPNGNAFIQLRRDPDVRSNNALYLGDFDGTNAWAAVTIQASGSRSNTDPRITFVFIGNPTNASGVEYAQNPSWQFREASFGADYIDLDTLEHVQLDVIRHDFTNSFYLGHTNYGTFLIGTNLTAATNLTVTGTLNPSGGTIGDRTYTTNATPALNTLYTNNARRGWFTTSVYFGGGEDAILRGVTYKQGGTFTNYFSLVQWNDNAGQSFNTVAHTLTFPLNPNDVFYIDRFAGADGTFTIVTNTWKIISE